MKTEKGEEITTIGNWLNCWTEIIAGRLPQSDHNLGWQVEVAITKETR